MIVVEPYNKQWEDDFCVLKSELMDSISVGDIAIEHVGSTSVKGLYAKPIIDIDIVAAEGVKEIIINDLAKIGYEHRGNLGIEGREAFRHSKHIKHHLYLVDRDCIAYKNHIVLRDYLRKDKRTVEEYSRLKLELAEKYPEDMDKYVAGKTEFITDILRKSGMSKDSLEIIHKQNQIPE